MGSFLAYTLYSGIFLLAGYLAYRLFMSGEKQTALNRFALLAIYACSFAAWPLSRLDLTADRNAGDAAVFVGHLATRYVGLNESGPSAWPMFLIGLYLAGVAVVALLTAVSVVRLMMLVRKGRHEMRDGYVLVVMPDASVAPFSFGRYVVIGETDLEAAGNAVVSHELAHIRYRHYLDLILAQTVCILLWYIPASWLMREELRILHEYQADASVIDSGADPKEYQMLLIRKAVGRRFMTLANSLSHNKLKTRIAMMQKEKSSVARRFRALALAVAPAIALTVVNIPAVASGLQDLRDVAMEPSDSPVSVAAHDEEPLKVEKVASVPKVASKEAAARDKDGKTAETSERIAEFPGGEQELYRYMAQNLRYPEEAQDADHTGRSVVRFTVNADGTLSDIAIAKSSWPELDAEAIRVVKTMPKWEPAYSGGKPVDSEYTLPVHFALQGNASGKEDDGNVHKAFEEVLVVGYAGEGRAPKIRLSGASGEKKPAIFIDGKRYEGDLDGINPEDIQSISVWKDDEVNYPEGRIDITMKEGK